MQHPPYGRGRRGGGGRGARICPFSRGCGDGAPAAARDLADPGSCAAASPPRQSPTRRRRERRGWGGRGCRSPAASGGGTHTPRSSPVCPRGPGRCSNRSTTATRPWHAPRGREEVSARGSENILKIENALVMLVLHVRRVVCCWWIAFAWDF